MYEYRHYVAREGCFQRLVDRFFTHTVDLFDELGIEVVATWVTREPTGSELHYLLRWTDETARTAGWSRFLENPRWARVKKQTEPDGPLIAKLDSYAWLPDELDS